MRVRLQNTFVKIFKNKTISVICTKISYKLLFVFYCFIRLLKKQQSTIDLEQARTVLNHNSEKPQMSVIATNKISDIDLSIVVPAYNSQKTITECIKSVIEQETKYNYELIIVNDGSKDNTKKIVESFDDQHIVLINQENKGFSGARNRGIDESKGKYIMFLDSDDAYDPSFMLTMLEAMLRENADIVVCRYYAVEAGNEIRLGESLPQSMIFSHL